MKVLIPPIYERLSNKDRPFDDDSFGRHEFAINLTNLFQNTDDGLVVTIDSDWGDGKTTFIKLWEMELNNKPEFIPIYYDAFKNDFSSDAFLSIATLIHQELQSYLENSGIDVKNSAQLEYLIKESKNIAVDLMAMAADSLVPGIKLSKFVKKLIGTFEVDVDDKYRAHIDSIKSISKYQKKLTEILQIDSNSDPKKIVFFVDELDRCRPDFAVEVIEKIKHLFNIDNVYFVLAINRTQLVSTISSVYGVEKSDSEIYLQKFVHLETRLPPMVGLGELRQGDADNIYQHLSKLCKELKLEELLELGDVDLKRISELMTHNSISINPRGIERMMSLIAVAMGSTIDKKDRNSIRDYSSVENEETVKKTDHKAKSIFPMAALKIGNPLVYDNWKGGEINDGSISLFDWYKAYFKDELPGRVKVKGSNLYSVEGLNNICHILDIYRFPETIDINMKAEPGRYNVSANEAQLDVNENSEEVDVPDSAHEEENISESPSSTKPPASKKKSKAKAKKKK